MLQMSRLAFKRPNAFLTPNDLAIIVLRSTQLLGTHRDAQLVLDGRCDGRCDLHWYQTREALFSVEVDARREREKGHPLFYPLLSPTKEGA